MGIDPASDGAWYSDHDNSFTGVGVSFHCNLNKFTGVALCEMTTALSEAGALSSVVRNALSIVVAQTR